MVPPEAGGASRVAKTGLFSSHGDHQHVEALAIDSTTDSTRDRESVPWFPARSPVGLFASNRHVDGLHDCLQRSLWDAMGGGRRECA